MERVSGTARQKALALQKLGKNDLQNLCTSTCAIIIQLISLITNNSTLHDGTKSAVSRIWEALRNQFFKAQFF